MAKQSIPTQVSVIILCWNNRDLLEECIESVYAQTYPNCHIILVDNGSTDGSVDYVKQHHSSVELIETGENLGFAIGNNIGIKRALENNECQYIVLLNTDATIAPDWIERLLAFAQKHPKLASVQSPTVDYYDHKVLDSCGIVIDRQALATQVGYRQTNVRLETQRVFGVNAAAALFSRAFLEAQPFGDDYLDHDLWMYLEDVDIATRAVMMGWENWFLNESCAYHMGSASSGKNPGFSLYMTYRNNALVLIKNLPWRIILKTLPGLLRAEMHRLQGFWREGKYSLIRVIIKGRLVSIGKIPLFLRKRKQFKKYWRITEADLWELMRLPKLAKISPKDRPYGSEMVTFVILSRNDMGHVERCLNAVIHQNYPNKRIILVDNGSTDGTLKLIQEKYPDINVIPQRANLGIPNGFNIGLTAALQDKPEYFVLLRANTSIESNWLDIMVETMRRRPKAFATTSKLLQANEEATTVLNQGYSYHPVQGPSPVSFKGEKECEVFAASDHASIFRIESLNDIGMMDGHFFDGLEDLDYCFRARLAGWKIYSQPRAKAIVTTTQTLPPSAQWYHHQKNLFFIYAKNLPFKLFWKYLPLGVVFAMKSFSQATAKGYLYQQVKAAIKCGVLLPRMLRDRRRINIHRRERSVSIDKVLQRGLGEPL